MQKDNYSKHTTNSTYNNIGQSQKSEEKKEDTSRLVVTSVSHSLDAAIANKKFPNK